MSQSLDKLSNEELWQLFPIIISEHQPEWKNTYEAEKKVIQESIGNDHIARVNHIGSTFVPNLPAKPTIDILLEVKKDVNTEWLIQTIKSIGYIYSPQPGNPPPHMMFMKGYTDEGFKGQAYHLHVRYPGDWNELYFRDYLCKHNETAQKYGELKRTLKEKFEHDRDKYTTEKSDFIKGITELARKEFPDKYIPTK